MATATLITDGGRSIGNPPMLRRTRNGWEGSREYMVNTHDEYQATIAGGVPAYGDPWDSTLKDLTAASFETRYIARKDDPTGTGGLTVVRVDYLEEGVNGHLPPPTLATKFTILNTSSETQTIWNDLDAPALPGSPPVPLAWPINDGQGFAKKVGVVTARVYVYFPLNQFPDMARLVRLARKKAVSTDSLVFPHILGTSVNFALSPGQVQYEGFSHQIANGFVEVVHELNLAPDFKLRWRYENADGYPEGDEMVSRIYEAEPLAGLW